jgi:hypothetical protein
MEGGAVGHNFEKDIPRDHLCQVWTLHRCFLPNLAPFGQKDDNQVKIVLRNENDERIELPDIKEEW